MTPVVPEDTTGAGVKGQQAVDAESARVEAEQAAVDAKARGDRGEEEGENAQARRSMMRYYKAIDQPLNPKDYGQD